MLMSNLNQLDNFYKYIPPKVVAGKDKYQSLLDQLPKGKILLVTSKNSLKRKSTSSLIECLKNHEVDYFNDVKPNPDLDDIEQTIARLRKNKYESIIALGGGSSIDTAKVLSVSLNAKVLKPLSNFFRNNIKLNWKKNLFFVAIPTTSGSGSEVTSFATVWDFFNNKKFSLEGSFLYPDLVILDPELTLTLPRDLTLFPGLDATSHALESIWNSNSDEISDDIAYKSLSLILHAFPKVLKDPRDIHSRAIMQQASLLSGVAINRTKSAIAHSISYPLTTRYAAPHGIACSFTLPYIIDFAYEKNNSFFRNDHIINEIKLFLQSLNLKNEIGRYANNDDILDIVDEMYSPERAKNFFYNVSLDDIKQIVKNSI